MIGMNPHPDLGDFFLFCICVGFKLLVTVNLLVRKYSFADIPVTLLS